MEKITCDIIRDLIPAYVDDICSDSTRNCVEEHVSNCKECREMLSLCRDSMLSADQIEKKELDAWKKLKRKIRCQQWISCLLLLFLILLGIRSFAVRAERLTQEGYFALLFVCMSAALLIGNAYKSKEAPNKADYAVVAASVFADVSAAGMIGYFMAELTRGGQPFGMAAASVGPFLDRLLTAGFLLQMAFILYHGVVMLRKEKNCSVLLCLDIMGGFLMLGYDDLLKGMETYAGFFRSFARTSLGTAGIGVLAAAAGVCFARVRRKKGGAL